MVSFKLRPRYSEEPTPVPTERDSVLPQEPVRGLFNGAVCFENRIASVVTDD
jgi:hypothetical protein